MDFINKFKHGDESEHEEHKKHGETESETAAQATGSTQQEESHSAAENAADKHEEHEEHEHKRDFLGKLIGGSGHHSKHGSGDEKDKDKSFFDKLHSKEDRERKNLELEKRELELNFELERVLKEQKDNQGFFDRLKDKFDGDVDKEKVLEHPPRDEDGEKPSFFDKLTGKDEREKKAVELERKEAEIRAELDKVKHDKKENQDLLERIKDKLDGETDDEEERKKAHEKPSFFDKITGKAEEEERRRKEEEDRNAFKKLGDRINEGLGGGHKAEEKEDFLDKTIDGFQEHILRKGTQSNESAFEQAKDAQIAAAIRSQLHLKDKKDDHHKH
ncbi:hypothetical protein KVR01_012303 [Diaporthe batatas]|uniref:uncharacterized protein n=1 Tax=Diaporthe batatas TaxID=748121 RepID=UPI001D052196|nr:uncharacterized protein KVR01_012303 [Diaporthe batatas]KAG8158031.1 hypothetical protein KVR01_012303 [Diaporthe batatas]